MGYLRVIYGLGKTGVSAGSAQFMGFYGLFTGSSRVIYGFLRVPPWPTSFGSIKLYEININLSWAFYKNHKTSRMCPFEVFSKLTTTICHIQNLRNHLIGSQHQITFDGGQNPSFKFVFSHKTILISLLQQEPWCQKSGLSRLLKQ